MPGSFQALIAVPIAPKRAFWHGLWVY
jgi:hypothetical protein